MKKIMLFVLVLLIGGLIAAQEKFVEISSRKVPIAAEVDLLVVGGEVADVAAAVEASKAGAKVLLVSPYPYLGDDLTATLQLWNDKDAVAKANDPLLTKIYDDPLANAPVSSKLLLLTSPKKIPFTYTILEPLDEKHPEAPKNQKPRLTDGLAENATNQSLQINGDATIIVDLKKEKQVGAVVLFPFLNKGDYHVDGMNVYRSDNGENWKKVGPFVKPDAETPGALEGPSLSLKLDKPVKTRYLKVDARKAQNARRILLGELIVFPDAADTDIQPPQPAEAEKGWIMPRPMHVKRVLDKELLDNNVQFLYSTFLTDELVDDKGNIRGALITNRAGRQAVIAKTIVRHEKPQALPGTKFALPDTKFVADFVVIGGEPKEISSKDYPLILGATSKVFAKPFYGPWPNLAKTTTGEFHVVSYQIDIARETALKIFDGDLNTVYELEKQIRLATFHPDQQFTSDRIDIRDKESPIYANFLPEGLKKLRELMKNAVSEIVSKGTIDPSKLSIKPAKQTGTKIPGDVKEMLNGWRGFGVAEKTMNVGGEQVPVVGEYDVLVVGGGTSGVPAAIGAARQGAKTLLVEYLHELGGVETAGAISVYCHGFRGGFTKEVESGKNNWNIEQRIDWFRRELAKSGVETWHGVLATGAVTEKGKELNTVKGVLLATPFGPKVVLAKTVIDSTGNGDVAAAAGATMVFAEAGREPLIQGAGLPPRDLGASYTNTDYMYVYENDMVDATHVFVYAKDKFQKAFDLGKMLDTRERRRIVGETTFTVLDQNNRRTYPDTICYVITNYDSHGTMSHRLLEFPYSYYQAHSSYVPYRASLPKGLDGILVSGLATSSDRDASAIFRMQPDLQNQGYALGYIAATARKDGVSLRKVDIRQAQKHLVEIGNLLEDVLTHEDNFETTIAELPDAVKSILNDYEGINRILWHPKESLPLLREAFAKATIGDATDIEPKVVYATALAAIDDPTGADVLLAKVKSFEKWDEGPKWSVPSNKHGFSVSELGRLVLALGRTKDKRAIPVIVEKLELLKPGYRFTHSRPCLLALESIGGPEAAAVVAKFLDEPRIAGNVQNSAAVSTEAFKFKSQLELTAARVLYRCGDTPDGKARKILEAYTKDIRGFYARYAEEVLMAQ